MFRISPTDSWSIIIQLKIWVDHLLPWIFSTCMIVIFYKCKSPIVLWIFYVLHITKRGVNDHGLGKTYKNYITCIKIYMLKNNMKWRMKPYMIQTLTSSTEVTPGPTSITAFFKSSSPQFLGTLPINKRCFAWDVEHLIFLPYEWERNGKRRRIS